MYRYESPELFRFQIVAHGLLDAFMSTYKLPGTPVHSPSTSPSTSSSSSSKHYSATSSSHSNWGEQIGQLLSCGISSFLAVPLASQVSLAFQVIFGSPSHSNGAGFSSYRLYRPFNLTFLSGLLISETFLIRNNNS